MCIPRRQEPPRDQCVLMMMFDVQINYVEIDIADCYLRYSKSLRQQSKLCSN